VSSNWHSPCSGRCPQSSPTNAGPRIIPRAEALYRRNLRHLQDDCKPALPNLLRLPAMDIARVSAHHRYRNGRRANQWTNDLRAVVVMPDHAYMIFTPYQILREQKYSR
jgi:hypothetical protein